MTETLSSAVDELREAGAAREATSIAAVADTQSRLTSIEAQLSKTAQMLQRTEKLLAPLPSAAVDQAAYGLMRGEVLRLDAALAQTQRQMAAMATTKAAKSELAAVRTAVTRFLFGTAPPAPTAPPTPAPPTPSYPPPALPPADALATLQATYAEPRPPPFKPAAAGTRPRPTRPSTARGAPSAGLASGVTVAVGPPDGVPAAPPGVGAHRAHRRAPRTRRRSPRRRSPRRRPRRCLLLQQTALPRCAS